MSNLEVAKVSTCYQQTSTVVASTNTVTLVIANTAGANVANSFQLGVSRIAGIRLSSDAAGLIPLLVGSTIFPALSLPYVHSIAHTAAAGATESISVVFRMQASTVGNGYITLVWYNEVGQAGLYNC